MFRVLVQRLLTVMLPTEEEKAQILEAQIEQPELPLGSAEQFLLTLSSISELRARLMLWAFKVDFEVLEQVSAAVCRAVQQPVPVSRRATSVLPINLKQCDMHFSRYHNRFGYYFVSFEKKKKC